MPKLIDVIRRVFPNGTSPLTPQSWEHPPFWPPDAFAISATLVNHTGFYPTVRYSTANSPDCIFTEHFRKQIKLHGKKWAKSPLPDQKLPKAVRSAWKGIYRCANQELTESTEWHDSAIRLMILADEASAGVGFYDPDDPTPMNYVLYKLQGADYLTTFSATRHTYKLPGRVSDEFSSLTWMVDSSEVVVQPKSRTPQVGCTLRSLSHHLCLLPPVGEVKTRWLSAQLADTEDPLNLLLVPFPFHLDSNSFRPSKMAGSSSGRFFEINQDWLRYRSRPLPSAEIAKFLIGLLKAARKETNRVHGIILPEAALSDEHAQNIAHILSKQEGLELFITGVSSQPQANSGRLDDNKAASFIFSKKAIFTRWQQHKHHRWKLDEGQIRRYHLGDALDYRHFWWEHIDLHDRQCTFYVFRAGASLATLICEDLARIEPVQTILRAVGPNLVIVLLMDGPQLEKRWPGRYATTLADDPGSAVLTLTSLGMVRRSRMPGEIENRTVALWKEPGGEAKELRIPHRCHGLLVTLSPSFEENFTMDNRSDGKKTVRLSLTGVRGVAHPSPQQWVDDNRRIW